MSAALIMDVRQAAFFAAWEAWLANVPMSWVRA